MRIETLRKVIPMIFNELDKQSVPFIWGLHGTGKSECIEQICKENGWKMQDFRLNLMADEGDIIGLQDFIRNAEGSAIGVSHIMPTYLAEMFKYCKDNPKSKGVLFFDEVNRANRFAILGVLFQITTARRLHLWNFPDNLHIVLAGNPDTEDYNVLNIEDKALLDRFIHLKFTPSTEEFFGYMADKKKDATFCNFFKEQPCFIESAKLATFDISSLASPSRRSLDKNAEPVYRLYKEEKIDLGTMTELLHGIIGGEATSAFVSYIGNIKDHPMSPEDFFKKKASEMKRIKGLASDGRIDVLKVTLDNAIDSLEEKKRITDKEYKALVDFMVDIAPADLVMGIVSTKFYSPAMSAARKSTENYRHRDLCDHIVKGRSETKPDADKPAESEDGE